MEPVDFTNCERLPGRAYNGAARYKTMFEPFLLADTK